MLSPITRGALLPGLRQDSAGFKNRVSDEPTLNLKSLESKPLEPDLVYTSGGRVAKIRALRAGR